MTDTETTPEAAKKDNTVRQGIAIALAILFGIALISANHVGWVATTVLRQDVFVRTLEPLPQDPDVARALADNVAAGIIETYEVREAIAETLPENLTFIAVPLTDGIEGIVSDVVSKIIESDPFSTVWSFALQGVHKAATVYIGTFDGEVLQTEDGVAVIDLTEVGAQVSEELGSLGFDLLEGADTELKIELFELPDSGILHALVQLMTSIRWATIIATFGLLAAAYAVATNRRKISLWIGGATVLAMLVSLIDIRYLRSAITGGIEDPVQQAGAVAAWDIIFQRFVAQSWVVLLIGVVVLFAAWVSGDSERAVSVRSTFVNASRSRSKDADEPSRLAVSVREHKRLLEWGAVVIGSAVLLIGPPFTISGLAVVLVAIVVIVILVEFIAASAETNT